MEASVRRPFLLAVVALLAMVQAVIGLLVGIALIIEHADPDLVEHVSQSTDELLTVGIVALIVSAIQLVVAIGLWRGNDLARLFIAALEIFHLAAGVYIVIAYDGTYRWQGIWQILLALLILYILFNRRSERFFTERSV